MSIGFWQILLVVALIVILFGRGKISGLMGDVAQGIKSFKKGMAEDDTPEPRTLDQRQSDPLNADRVDHTTKVG